MSVEAARAFMQRIKRGIIIEHNFPSTGYDGESALSVIVNYGAAAGFSFTEWEFETVVTQEVEAHLAEGKVQGEGNCVLFLHDLAGGSGDYLIFSRGVKEQDGMLMYGDSFVNLRGGTVR